jgi:lipoprotein-anchoring transpeptidase ErfK/SrfK
MTVTRRTLLKLGVAGLGYALMPRVSLAASSPQTVEPVTGVEIAGEVLSFGRALKAGATVRAEPNLKAKRVRSYKSNEVLPVLKQESTQSGTEHNKRWLEVEDGYVHSAELHLVPWTMNAYHITDAGETGFWAELTVPFFDARTGPSLDAGRSRHTYMGGSIFKVQKVHTATADADPKKLLFGNIDRTWYQVENEQFPGRYFVPAAYLRPLEDAEFYPISPEVAPEDKTIEVNIKAQRVTAFEKGKEVFSCVCATGTIKDGRDFTTPKGDWFVYRKTPSQHMWGGAIGRDGAFDLPGVPWVSYFTTTGVAFHGTYWHNDYGRPQSSGCVNVETANAKWLWRWTMPYPDPDPKNWYTQAAYRKPDFKTVTRVKVV